MSLDWQELCENIKSRYNTLYEQRISGIEEDNRQLLNKIRQYKECHQIAMDELNLQNEELERELQSRRNIKQKLYSVQNTIDKFRNELGKKDPILKIMFKDRIFKLVGLSDVYTFEVEGRESYVFHLKYNDINNSIIYRPKSVPKWIIDSDLTHIIEFEFSELTKLCNMIVKYKINYDK